MSRFLINAYSLISEIALWVMFIGAATAGAYAGGLGGLLIGLLVAFLFSVFAIAPLMMLDDIRKSTLRLEKMATDKSTSSFSDQTRTTKMEPSLSAGEKQANGSGIRNKPTGKKFNDVSSDSSPAYLGRKISRTPIGFEVESTEFATIEDAIAHIEGLDMPSDDEIRQNFSLGDTVASLRDMPIVLSKDGFGARGIDFPTFAGAVAYIKKM